MVYESRVEIMYNLTMAHRTEVESFGTGVTRILLLHWYTDIEKP